MSVEIPGVVFKDPKTYDELLSELTQCMMEAVRLRESLDSILLMLELSGGKMRERLDTAAEMIEEALYDDRRWQGVEKFIDTFHMVREANEAAKKELS